MKIATVLVVIYILATCVMFAGVYAAANMSGRTHLTDILVSIGLSLVVGTGVPLVIVLFSQKSQGRCHNGRKTA